MLDVLTAEDVRRQDAACAARGISTGSLMENAGFAVARAARDMLGGSYGKRIVVVCGKGNNAGDGLVAGRWLAMWGAHVTAVLTSDGGAFSGAAASSFDRFSRAGRIVALDALDRELGRADLAIDAIFGVGLNRPPEGPMAEAIRQLGRLSREVPILSVDVPSGVDADTGQAPGDILLVAERTVTLSGIKPGLLFSPGRGLAGRVEVADIGIPPEVRVAETRAHCLESDDIRRSFPKRGGVANKRNSGTALLVAGSRAMPGAAALVAGGCVHGGAGLTVLAATEAVCQIVLTRVPEITTIPLPETPEGTIDEKALDLIRTRIDEFHAIAIGPGLSTHPPALEAIRKIVSETALPIVIDADAITAFAGSVDLLARRNAPTILTPHAGELARLLDWEVGRIEADRLTSAREAARRLNAIVLLKGPGTIIADPAGTGPVEGGESAWSGHAYVNRTGNQALAQGGTGDVLTGLIGALWAQRSKRAAVAPEETDEQNQWQWPFMAAAGAWIHGAAGDKAWERYGPHPANASMLIELLPDVIHEVAG